MKDRVLAKTHDSIQLDLMFRAWIQVHWQDVETSITQQKSPSSPRLFKVWKYWSYLYHEVLWDNIKIKWANVKNALHKSLYIGRHDKYKLHFSVWRYTELTWSPFMTLFLMLRNPNLVDEKKNYPHEKTEPYWNCITEC